MKFFLLYLTLLVMFGCGYKEYEKVIDLPFGVLAESFVMSSDGENYAYLMYDEGKISVYVNSRLVGSYENISKIYFMNGGEYFFTVFDKGKRFVVQSGVSHKKYDFIESVYFSGDNKTLVYLARDGNYFVVVSNGVEVGSYERIFSDGVVVASNGRIAFVGYSKGKYYVVVDGVEKLVADRVVWNSLKFDPTGRHWNVVVKNKNDTFSLIVNGEVIGNYDSILYGTPVFSPDGNRFVFAFLSNKMSFVFFDDRLLGPYEEILYDSISFSSDGSKVIFVVKSNDYFYYVIDGKNFKPYKFLGQNSLVFSHDGKKFAFVAGNDTNEMFVVENGIEKPSYGSIIKGSLVYDNYGRLVYLVKSNGYVVVYDGVPRENFEMVYDFKFSPKGNFIIYVVEKDGKEVAIVNGVAQKKYDYISGIYFSPDSKHYGYVVKDKEKWFLVVDGVEQKKYAAIGVVGGNLFVKDGILYLGIDDKIYVIRKHF